jgi:hypothetical protein
VGFGDVAKARRLEAGPGSVNLLKGPRRGYPGSFPQIGSETMIRDDIKAAQLAAMKAGDKPRTAATRLIMSAVKNREIELRGSANAPDDDVMITEVLQKMIKQRRESIGMYEQGGRQELADAEAAEVAVIEEFLPKQMSADETRAAIDSIAAELGASSLKDMGRLMAALKERHAGGLDMSKASALVKARLSA